MRIAHSESPPPRLISGKYVLLAVVALGLAGAAGGWWYQHHLQRRALELWGAGAARLILSASDVQLCRIEPSVGDAKSIGITVDGKGYWANDCIDATRIPGFLHLRHSLLNSYSFDWNDVASGDHHWRYAIRFRDGDQTASILISADFSYAMLAEAGSRACIKPIAHGIEQVFGQPSKH